MTKNLNVPTLPPKSTVDTFAYGFKHFNISKMDGLENNIAINASQKQYISLHNSLLRALMLLYFYISEKGV